MSSHDSMFRWATLGALVLVAFALLTNTCAMDRLERQVIRQTKALESALAAGGAGAVGAPAPPARPSTERVPGEGTGLTAVGWGDRRAEILFVEGAKADAPLRLQDKPRPQGDWYVSRRSSAPSSLNPFATGEADASTISGYVVTRLLALDLDAPPRLEPSLAVSWEVAADGLTITYRLRKGVLFADGRPFTSADVRFSFDVQRDPAVNAQHLRPAFEDVTSLETPDPHVVVVTLRKRHWRTLHAVGYDLRILNAGWYQAEIPRLAAEMGIGTFSTEPGKPGFGEFFNRITAPCPGTGPYAFAGDRYDASLPVELRQNPFYWGIQVHPERYNMAGLRWVFIQDEVAAFEEFRKGGFDASVVEFDVLDNQLKDDPTITSMSRSFEYDHPGLGWTEIVWNCRRPPFDDARVRRAMAHLLDREWIVREVQHGRGSVATCPTMPSYPSHSPDIVPHALDVERAKTLLAEAGWTDSDGDGVLDRRGQRFEFELKTGSPRRFHAQLATALQEGCAKVGIRVTPRTLEWAAFLGDLDERRFDAATLVRSFASPMIDPAETWHSSQDIPRGGNDAGWRSDRADAILERMRVELDDDRRDELFRQFNHVFHEEQPVLLVTHSTVGVLLNSRFEEARVRPTGLQFVDFWVKPENVRHR